LVHRIHKLVEQGRCRKQPSLHVLLLLLALLFVFMNRPSSSTWHLMPVLVLAPQLLRLFVKLRSVSNPNCCRCGSSVCNCQVPQQ
jgi:hypothetical protein